MYWISQFNHFTKLSMRNVREIMTKASLNIIDIYWFFNILHFVCVSDDLEIKTTIIQLLIYKKSTRTLVFSLPFLQRSMWNHDVIWDENTEVFVPEQCSRVWCIICFHLVPQYAFIEFAGIKTVILGLKARILFTIFVYSCYCMCLPEQN